MSKTMKAVRIHSYGSPEVLVYEEAPRPEPSAGEVQIRVHAVGVNPVDSKTRRGGGVARFMPNFPLILGWDVSGTVTALGEGVEELKIGDEVYGMIRFPQMGGGYAEYATAPAEELVRKPTKLDHYHAAAIPLAALTAWQALFDIANVNKGQNVVVHAAAGGVGHLAIQLLQWKGAKVIATASEHSREFLEKFGVDRIVDYKAVPFESVIRDVDVVFDAVGGEVLERSYGVVKPGGIVVSIVSQPSNKYAAENGVKAEWVLVKPNREQLLQITDLVEEGVLKPVIDRVLPLSEAKVAQELSEAGHTRGKIVLNVID